jgi:hypothetical protein
MKHLHLDLFLGALIVGAFVVLVVRPDWSSVAALGFAVALAVALRSLQYRDTDTRVVAIARHLEEVQKATNESRLEFHQRLEKAERSTEAALSGVNALRSQKQRPGL